MQNLNKYIKKEASIPYPLYKSQEGEYFIGQTPILTGETQYTLSALVNPINSSVNIYVNTMTITNISALNLSAEFYIKSTFNGGITSNSVTCTNQSVIPEPIPFGEIHYLTTTSHPPMDGVSIFSRIVSPYSTLVVDGGQIIIPPGQSLIIYIGGFIPIVFDSVIFALGWWEENIYKFSNCYC